ncbi:MAG: amidohydrolase family protein [Bryobacteraceae bacterium]
MRFPLFALAATLAFAQSSTAPRPIVIKAARMFDGVSDRVVSPGLVVVLGEKIRGVGGKAEIPDGSDVIDLGDATILPGFMDAHTHLTMQFEFDFRKQQMDVLTKNVAEQALDASVNARVTLMAGFTTVRDVGGADFIDVGLRNAIASGKVPGPRMLVATNAIGATGGHCDNAAGYKFGLFGRETGIQDGVANGPDQMRLIVRFNIKYGADVIKTCATGGVLSLTDDVDTPQLTQAELDALVDEAHALRRKTAAHAHGASGAKRAIRAGIDSIEHGSFLDDEALDMMKARGTYYVPTMMAAQGLREVLEKGYVPPQIAAKARAAMASLDSVVAKAIAKQVRIALGTDAAVYPHGRNPEEFAQMVRVGMNPIDALKSGTSVDAQLLGLFDKTGSLKAGKWADIVAVPGNPVEDIHATEKVTFVMKEGTVFKNAKR